MLKYGEWRALRNLPVGWLTHSIHGRDKTERTFHIIVELIIWLALFGLWRLSFPNFLSLYTCAFTAFLLVHTFMWIIDGNFHVYMLDSFFSVKNAGIKKVLDFIVWSSNLLKKTDSVECVLVYGSFCRGMFHDRSDLDMRVVRSKPSKKTIILLTVAVYIRGVSLLRGIPTDLQVVDSKEFLARQMRLDEKPVVVYCRENFKIPNQGVDIREMINDPLLVLKCKEKNECVY